MTRKKNTGIGSLSTEERIKDAARKVFMRKGFSAARTRDIAEEAGLNLALLNYYFRSKQKLFDTVMQEKIQTLLKTIIPVIHDSTTTLDEKIKLLVFNYMRVLKENNELPLFVLSELQKNNNGIVTHLPGKALLKTSFFQQVKQRNKKVNPLHFLLSLLGLIIFPFITKPALITSGMITEKEFYLLVSERELLIPLWMDTLLK